MPSTVSVSAPGKVLLAGGYLVLDRDYTGLVFGLDARIHVCVQDLIPCEDKGLYRIIVQSPQFQGAVWQYKGQNEDGKLQPNQYISISQVKE